MAEEPGWINAPLLIPALVLALAPLVGVRKARDCAAAVIAVLRRRGLLNQQGVDIAIQELGPLPR